MKVRLLYLLAAFLMLLPFALPDDPVDPRKVIVLGFDGLDPGLLADMMDTGKLPAFAHLRATGTFVPLATTNPALSPVAWSSFITGNNPGKHNIFDFISRDLETYYPKLAINEFRRPDTIKIGKYTLPLGEETIISNRKGEPFWQTAHHHGIPTVALHIPVTFPPDVYAERMLSGMGVPDVIGSNGTFTLFTTDESSTGAVEGGRIVDIRIVKNRINEYLRGPPNEFLADKPELVIPFEGILKDRNLLELRIQDQKFEISVGEWTPWIRIHFDIFPTLHLKAICKFYLKSIEPEFELYTTPINFDPAEPAVLISNPPSFSRELSDLIGPFYTQGMPEDTWALNERRISDQTFLEQVAFIQQERLKIFFSELQRFRGGIIAAVFVSSDRLQHMFWRLNDRQNHLYNEYDREKLGNVVEKSYQFMDSIVQRVLKYIDANTILIVISDHGFASFRRNMHLNSLLIKEGLIQLNVPYPEQTGPFFENVDWSHTKAYAMGLNGIYLNIKGRESQGIVDPRDVGALKRSLIDRLGELTDPETGTKAIRRVFDTSEVYSGEYLHNAPDLLIGYAKGYRASWQTVLGAAPAELFQENTQKWSGDHAIDPVLVPGIFLSNRLIDQAHPSIMDIAPTILAIFGIDAPHMDGNDLGIHLNRLASVRQTESNDLRESE